MNLGQYNLRPYQQLAVDRCRAELARLKAAGLPSRVVLCLPTGAGKTVVSCAVMKLALEKGRRCTFLASGRILITQKSRKLSECGINHKVLMADSEAYPLYESSDAGRVLVASKDTLHARRIAVDTDLLIVDEAHGSISETWQAILTDAGCPVIGLTATPARGDGKGLGEFYQSIVSVTTYDQLVAEGSLVPCRVVAPFEVAMETPNGPDWSASENERAFNHRVLVGRIVENWQKWGEGRPTFVYAMTVAHAKELCDEFNGHGIAASLVHANTTDEEREDIYRRFNEGRDRVLCNVGVLAVGADFPKVSCGVLAFSTKSIVKFRQVAGRLFRPSDGKQDALLIDHGGNYARHGWPQDEIEWTLQPTEACEPAKEDGCNTVRKPSYCPKCSEVWRRGAKCPKCGYVPRGESHSKLIRVVDGELREVRRKSAKVHKVETDFQKSWLRCVAIAANKGMSAKQAKIIFKSRMGVWPSDSLRPWAEPHQWDWKAATLWPGFVRRRKPVHQVGD